MTQPTTYLRQYNFTNYQTLNPTSPPPGTALDAEFSAVKVTLDGVLANLKLIQRDDGQIANLSVGYDQFKTEVVSGGINPASPWLTATAYTVGTCVSINNIIYRCVVAHTSGTFATDLANGKWSVIIDLSSVGSFLSGTATGNGVTTAYNLGVQIQDVNRVIWVENGAVKTPTVDYTVSGTTLTRTVAPGGGVAISWRLLGSVSLTVPSDGSVTTSKLADSSVTTAKLADLNVTTAKIADFNVTGVKIAINSVDSTKVAANSLTFSNFQTVATQTLVGRNSGGTGSMESVTATQVLDWIGATQGQLLFRDASNWAALGVGTLGQVLRTTPGAANPTWVGSMTLLTANTAASVATLDLALTSGYKRYRLILDNFIPATNAVSPNMRFSTDGGSTYKTTNYAWAGQYNTTAASSGTYDSSTGGTTAVVLTAAAVSNAAGTTSSYNIDIYAGTGSTVPTYFYDSFSILSGGASNAAFKAGGNLGFNGPLTHVRFLFSAGNIASISYALYGVN